MSKNKKDIGYYDLVANFLTPNPKSVEGLNNTSYMYYRQQLYAKIFSIFQFKNVPSNWNIDYLKNVLFSCGTINLMSTKFGILPLLGGFTGINVYNFPTNLIVGNPVLGNLEGEIGKDCELIYMLRVNECFVSFEQLVTRYALLLAQCDGTLNTSLMNSRIAHVFIGKSDAEVASLQKMYDEVSAGKPAIFLKKDQLNFDESEWGTFLNVKNTFIGNDVLLTKRTIMNEFLTEIGINNANTSKRERLNTDEVNANNAETLCLVELVKDTINECFKRAEYLTGQTITVELNPKIVYNYSRGDDNELD